MARVAGGKKFDKMTVKRVYFGNWLRDYCERPSAVLRSEAREYPQANIYTCSSGN
jgi:heterokaryon incompatibility protein Het-C